jgi:hypothetical protein
MDWVRGDDGHIVKRPGARRALALSAVTAAAVAELERRKGMLSDSPDHLPEVGR